MTVYDLSDVVRLRLEDISFFAVLLLVSGLVIRALWNVIARSVPALPKLPYRQALALTVILSLGMLLVLSMISGARELLTPGAWQRQGSAYKLNGPEHDSNRARKIYSLKAALFDYAAQHQGRFPPHDWGKQIPPELWEADDAGTHFIYFGGLSPEAGRRLIVVEPSAFGDLRYGLMADGDIRLVTAEEIARQVKEGGTR